MKKILLSLVFVSIALIFTSCTENYSNGERIGFITKFTKKGLIWDSWEGEMNVSQTGMTSNAAEFDFSFDNDLGDTQAELLKTVDSAVQYGWRVKVKYHETAGKNWLKNRGETSHFITGIEVLSRTPMKDVFSNNNGGQVPTQPVQKDTLYINQGRVDTIYVVIKQK